MTVRKLLIFILKFTWSKVTIIIVDIKYVKYVTEEFDEGLYAVPIPFVPITFNRDATEFMLNV